MLGNIVALFTLIPTMGYVGAAWARVIGYVIMATSLYVVGQKLYPVKREWGRVIKMVLLVVVFFFVGRSDYMMPQPWLKAALFLFYPLALLVIGFFQKDELSTVKRLLWRKTGS